MIPCTAVLDLAGHVHGEACGHPLVTHGDHSDFLVDGELHHVTSSCCSRQCVQGPVVISHGYTSPHLRRPHSLSTAALLPPAAPPSAPRPPPPPPRQLQTTQIYAAGICCPMETPLVHSCLDGMPGVEQVEVSVMAQRVTVRHDATQASPAALVAALNGAMLDASLSPPRTQATVKGRWCPPWNVLAGAALLAVSLLHYLSRPTGAAWLDHLQYVALGSVALCLPRIALRAALALRRGVADVHLLVTLATAGAIALSDYGEAAAVVVLFAVAEHWERRSADKARGAVEAVLALRPESAKLAASGACVPVEDVAPGTEVLVAPGESVPLDGEVVAGESALDESLLTGESAPALRGPGAAVHAGTLNVGSGVLRVRTTAAAGDTAVARMAALVAQATGQQSPAEALVARFARIYTPVVMAVCVLLAFLPWAFTYDVDRRKEWVYLSLQVLVTACPCALVLATPATVVCALARAAQHGVLIKSGAALEALRRVEVVTFDKTGTLTKGNFLVVSFEPLDGWSRHDLLRLLGSLERGSSHPLAAAILGYAAAQGVPCDAVVEGAELVQGAGLTATVDGRRIAAGSEALVAAAGAAAAAGPELDAARRAISAEGATACFVSVDGRLAGWLAARDAARPEAAEAVAMVASLGCRAAMLTGDTVAAAAGVGAAVGIAERRVHAALLPRDKLDKVAEYKKSAAPRPAGSACCAGALPVAACCLRGAPRPRRVWVAHCGDGVNDAPALAAADVGIAMGVAGSAAALEAGSVALFTNDLRAVPAALMLSRAAGRVILANIAFAIVTKVAVLVPAVMGSFTLWGAVLVDVGAALLVMGNALRLLKWQWPVVRADGGAAPCRGAEWGPSTVGATGCARGGAGRSSAASCAKGTCGAGAQIDGVATCRVEGDASASSAACCTKSSCGTSPQAANHAKHGHTACCAKGSCGASAQGASAAGCAKGGSRPVCAAPCSRGSCGAGAPGVRAAGTASSTPSCGRGHQHL